MTKSKYAEKLKDPRWQKRRLGILDRDEWFCQKCGDDKTTLNVHHRYYIKDKEPWDYPDEALITLCENCHEEEISTRKHIEASLLHTLRCVFWSGDLVDINVGFHEMYLFYPSEVMASICEWVLSNEEIMKELCGRYFEYLKKKREAKECQSDSQ